MILNTPSACGGVIDQQLSQFNLAGGVMIKRYIIFIAFVGLLFIVPGCADDDLNSAPASATITINPSSFKLSDGTATARTHTKYFLIAVKDVNGFSLKEITLRIAFIWAKPDIYGLVQFYHLGSKVNSPFNVSTDGNGTYTLRMDFLSGGGWEYKGTLQVTSAAAYGSADFEVDTGA
jgi:hypothetical protein